LKFIAALAAFSTEARFNYVVFHTYEITMKANAMAPNLEKRDSPFVAFEKLDIPEDTPCCKLGPHLRVNPPADAKKAKMETYGPVATSGGGDYAWKLLGAT
jgi:hypothetical protein